MTSASRRPHHAVGRMQRTPYGFTGGASVAGVPFGKLRAGFRLRGNFAFARLPLRSE